MIDGKAMLDHVLDALRPQVEAVVICGRHWPREIAIDDRTTDRIGPLGGLEAALRHAGKSGYDAVISVPVDTLPLPLNLRALLGRDGPAVFLRQHLIGYWPVRLAPDLQMFLENGNRAVGQWVEHANARRVCEPIRMSNVNYPVDLIHEQRTVTNKMVVTPTGIEPVLQP